MPLRDEDEVRAALLEQAGDNDGATQLLNILRWSLAGNAAAKRARLLSFLEEDDTLLFRCQKGPPKYHFAAKTATLPKLRLRL